MEPSLSLVVIWLADGFSENLFKLLSTEWVVLVESDEFVERVKAGLLDQVVPHPAIIHLVVNAAVTDSVNTYKGKSEVSTNCLLYTSPSPRDS